jgi:lysophospholipid acyltransferase (LPLAT)-like uncharacterized protein
LIRSAFAENVAVAAAAGYIRLIHATSRLHFIGRDHADRLLAERSEGFILAFWHERLLLAPLVRKETNREVRMLISAHRDGQMISRAVRSFGVRTISGSAANPAKPGKNRSGAAAVAEMTAAIAAGDIIGVTPDGPTGPRRIAKPGIVRLAAITGAPIVPAAASSSNGMRMNTWDRFLLAAPFSRAAFVARAPIVVPRDSDDAALEAACALLQSELNAAAAIADGTCGRADDAEAGR